MDWQKYQHPTDPSWELYSFPVSSPMIPTTWLIIHNQNYLFLYRVYTTRKPFIQDPYEPTITAGESGDATRLQVNVFRDDIRVALAPGAETSRDSLAAQHFRELMALG